MTHNTCNMGTHDLPDIYTLRLRVYISGKSLLPMLQLYKVLHVCIYLHAYIHVYIHNIIMLPVAPSKVDMLTLTCAPVDMINQCNATWNVSLVKCEV